MIEPLKIRPHHLEGAQRYIAFGKPKTQAMYDLLQNAVEENPDAEMILVDSVEDPVCQDCIAETRGECKVVFGEGETPVDMDREIAAAHGWELGRKYKVQAILDEITREAPNRSVFYFTSSLKEEQMERDGVVKSAYEWWRDDFSKAA